MCLRAHHQITHLSPFSNYTKIFPTVSAILWWTTRCICSNIYKFILNILYNCWFRLSRVCYTSYFKQCAVKLVWRCYHICTVNSRFRKTPHSLIRFACELLVNRKILNVSLFHFHFFFHATCLKSNCFPLKILCLFFLPLVTFSLFFLFLLILCLYYASFCVLSSESCGYNLGISW